MFTGVPWAIGADGAELPADVLRAVSYAATSGADGVVLPGDLKVRATVPASDTVIIDYGTAVIRNRSAGTEAQSYFAPNSPNTAEVRVRVSPTPSGGGRSDLVVVRIEDPQFPPWQPYPETQPDNIKDGPYVFGRAIEGVASTVRKVSQLGGAYATQSMYAVARIDRPASKGIVEGGDIADLRRIALPLSDGDLLNGPGGSSDLSGTVWRQWPAFQPQIEVPDWANWFSCSVTISGALALAASDGQFRLMLGDQQIGGLTAFDVNADPANGQRVTYVAAGTEYLPAGYAGSSRELRLEARRISAKTGVLRSDGGTTISYDFRFRQRAV